MPNFILIAKTKSQYTCALTNQYITHFRDIFFIPINFEYTLKHVITTSQKIIYLKSYQPMIIGS